jgi:phosphoglycolate phosphatase-like HAD superfamily hydrolase
MIEIIHNHFQRGRVRFAVFDFDGTLSLIREGWQQAMAETMMVELLQAPNRESEPVLGAIVIGLITRTTGQTASYQMAQLAEEVRKHGGQPQDPLIYKERYVKRLDERINSRVAAIKSGRVLPDEMMVPGSRAILEALTTRGVRCYLVSGAYEPGVLDESAALQITPYFDGIYGAQDDPALFSKKQFMERLVVENHLDRCEFISLGDGSIEIKEAKNLGGIAVGVASNETTRIGIDAGKRDLLIRAGADIIVPDFAEHEALVAYLLDVK